MNSLSFSPNTVSACSLFLHYDGFVGWCRGQQRSHLFQAIGQPGAGEGRWLAFAFLWLLCKFQNRKQKSSLLLSALLSTHGPALPSRVPARSGWRLCPSPAPRELCFPTRAAFFSVNSAGICQAGPSKFPSDDSSSDATGKRWNEKPKPKVLRRREAKFSMVGS